MQTATLFLRLIPNRSIKEDTIASIIEMELVNAAKNTSTKNKIPMIVPPLICSNTFGSVTNINPAPLAFVPASPLNT